MMIALYSRWFNRWGLLAGWLVGMVSGTWIASSRDFAPVWQVPVLGVTGYTGLVALALNLVVVTLIMLVLGRRARADRLDETRPDEYDELVETGRPAPTVGAGVT